MDTYPEQIGPYRLRHEIGRSALYIDYRAEDTHSGQEVILKLPGDAFPQRPARLTQFVSAGQRAVRLEHPNIAQVTAAGEADGYYYIASAYISGERLTDLLANRETPLDPEKALEIVADIAMALDYAHDAGIVHDGLTTDNIIVANDGRVLVADFCLAEGVDVAATQLAESPSAFETFFLAPEQLRSDVESDYRADVFGLGVVTYAMMTRRLPFEADSQGALQRAIVNDPPLPAESVNPDLPTGIAYVLRNALAKDPSVRYGGAGEFYDALVAGLAWNPAVGAATSSTTVAGGRRLGVILMALIGLVAIVAVAFLVLRPTGILPGGSVTNGDQGVDVAGVEPTLGVTLSETAETPNPVAVAAVGTSSGSATGDVTNTPTSTPTSTPSPTQAGESDAVSVDGAAVVNDVVVGDNADGVAAVPGGGNDEETDDTVNDANVDDPEATPSGVVLDESAVQMPILTNTSKPTVTATNTPRPTATATGTSKPTATATNTPRPTATATNTSKPTATATNTLRPTATATNTPRPTATATNTPRPTATATNTPRPTATATNTPLPLPTSTPRATATVTPIPAGAGAVQLLQPVDGSAGNDSQRFQWLTSVQPGAGQAFELVFWQAGQNPLASGFGLAAPTTGSEVSVDLNALDSRLGDLLEPGEYLWGLLLVQTDPYQRIQFMGVQNNFRFYREGGSSSSGGPPSSGE